MLRHRVVPLLALALVTGGCVANEDDDVPGPAPVAAPSPRPAVTGDPSAPLVLVLPAPSSLHPAEHARVLVAADRALAEASVDGPVRRVVLPRDGALPDVLAALAPEAGALCAIGAGAAGPLADIAARRPLVRVCTGIDPDLAGLGARLGAIARATAGSALVVVVASGDPLLGSVWTGAVVAAATDDAIGGVRVVGGADALGTVLAAGGVGAVVLDAGPASEAALAVLAPTRVPVLLAGVLADAPDGPAAERIAARYRVRWDLVLAPLLRGARAAPAAPPAPTATVEVEPGPAARTPSDPDEVAGLPGSVPERP